MEKKLKKATEESGYTQEFQVKQLATANTSNKASSYSQENKPNSFGYSQSSDRKFQRKFSSKLGYKTA